MLDSMRQKTEEELADMRGLTRDEVAVLVLLERRLAQGGPTRSIETPVRTFKGEAPFGRSAWAHDVV